MSAGASSVAGSEPVPTWSPSLKKKAPFIPWSPWKRQWNSTAPSWGRVTVTVDESPPLSSSSTPSASLVNV